MLPVVVVEMLEQLALRYGRARPVDQVLENAVLHWRKVDKPAGAGNALFERVHFDFRYAQRRVGRTLSAANQRLHASDQLSQIEWFAEIVVCPGVQQLDDRSGFVPCGQN